MQSQINPHFLYNTLDSINWLAMANGQDEISEMVTALSDTFRLSLKRTNSAYIPVSQEIEYLSSYLTLQKYRFGGQLSYSFHIQDEVNELYPLRFLLQPVVENSIKHGIRQLDNGGTIDITMSIRNRSNTVQMTDNTESKAEYLEIHMINDGRQIDLGKMKQLLEFDAATQTFLSFDQGSYGLQNINRKIKIVHGPDYGLKFSITKNQRTDCCIMLPVIRTTPDCSKAKRCYKPKNNRARVLFIQQNDPYSIIFIDLIVYSFSILFFMRCFPVFIKSVLIYKKYKHDV